MFSRYLCPSLDTCNGFDNNLSLFSFSFCDLPVSFFQDLALPLCYRNFGTRSLGNYGAKLFWEQAKSIERLEGVRVGELAGGPFGWKWCEGNGGKNVFQKKPLVLDVRFIALCHLGQLGISPT